MTLFAEINLAPTPDRLVVLLDGDYDFWDLAAEATELAQARMPKVSGATAGSLMPFSGQGFFGIYFPSKIAWFLERGISPFTMRSLAGKVIPMWVDDPTGKERRANPKAKTRTTRDGRHQVLIFRRAAQFGERRMAVRRNKNGLLEPVTVPRSYPGAPGRISRREAAAPFTAPGKAGGQVRAGNVGVRWRHPGTSARNTMNSALSETCLTNGITPVPIYAVDGAAFATLMRNR